MNAKNNYPTKKLGEICEIITGGTPRTSIKDFYGNEFLWAGPSDLDQGVFVIKTNKKLSKKGFRESGIRIIPKNSVMMSCIGYIGKLGIAGEEMATNQQINTFVPNPKLLESKYLYYSLMYKTEEFKTNSSQTTLPIINKTKCSNISIPLPPLEIQKKIVERIEKMMGKIDEAKKLRKEAMTEASSLIPSALHKIFEDGKKKGWEEKTIGEISEKTKRINPIEFFDKEFSYIDITSVSKSIDQVVRARILPTGEAPSRARNLVKEGDIIFATTRPYLKNIVMIPKNLSGSVASTGFCVIRPNKKIVDSSYIYYVVDLEYFLSKIIPLQRGATYPAVSDTDIYNQKILLPPLPEQRKIVKYLDSLSEKIRKIQALQSATDRELKLLEKSVLSGAFVI